MQLREFSALPIDWDMSPEDAVTLYLEWGNNSWHAKHQPVRSKSDYAHYFVVDNWGASPKVMLIKRNSEAAEELYVGELPEPLEQEFRNEFGSLKGIFEPTDAIKHWLQQQLDN